MSSLMLSSLQLHLPFIWLCAVSEIALIANEQHSLPFPTSVVRLVRQTLCSSADPLSFPIVYLTPFTLLGVLLTVSGSLLRMVCYRTLGSFFTFDLTIFPNHRLITSGPYAYVRHPAYTGSLLMIAGLALVNFTARSWLTECEIFGEGMVGVALRSIGASVWMCWWLAVGRLRCRTEDAELRKTFGRQWDEYAGRVTTWYLPWLF